MHNTTDNNEFTVEPCDGRWRARLTFYEYDQDEATRLSEINTGDAVVTLESSGVEVSVVESTPSLALASLWAACDNLGAWEWNEEAGR